MSFCGRFGLLRQTTDVSSVRRRLTPSFRVPTSAGQLWERASDLVCQSQSPRGGARTFANVAGSLAVKYGCLKFDHYLSCDQPFTVYTDNKPLLQRLRLGVKPAFSERAQGFIYLAVHDLTFTLHSHIIYCTCLINGLKLTTVRLSSLLGRTKKF